MIISKAIEILTFLHQDGLSCLNHDEEEATKLGIEALKRLHEHRTEHIAFPFRALPGETLENEK